MKKITLLLATAVMLQACGGGNGTNESESVAEAEEQMFDEIPDHAEDEMGMSYDEYLATYKDKNYTLKDGEKDGVYGLISLEDGGYPSATLTAASVTTDDTVSLYVMLEGGFSGYTSQELQNAVNNTHQVYLVYANKVERYPGPTIKHGDKDIGEGKSVTGVLEVHAEDMGGDLPGHFYVVKDDGTRVEFTDFWEEDFLKMNGKKVKQYYHEHHSNELKHMSTVE